MKKFSSLNVLRGSGSGSWFSWSNGFGSGSCNLLVRAPGVSDRFHSSGHSHVLNYLYIPYVQTGLSNFIRPI